MKLTQKMSNPFRFVFFASFTLSYMSQSQQDQENSAISVVAKKKNSKQHAKDMLFPERFMVLTFLKLGF